MIGFEGQKQASDLSYEKFVSQKEGSPASGWAALARLIWGLVLVTVGGAVGIVLRTEQGEWTWEDISNLWFLAVSPPLAFLGYKLGRIGPVSRWLHRSHPVRIYFARLALGLFISSTYAFIGMVSFFWDIPLWLSFPTFFAPALALFAFQFPR